MAGRPSIAVTQDEVPDKSAALQKKWGTKLGQLWEVGPHRLACGSWADNLPNEAIEAVITDPPYGVSVVKKGMVGADFGVAKKGKYRAIEGDDKPADLAGILNLCERTVIWGGNYFSDQLPVNGSWLVWDKRTDSGIVNTFADCELAWTNLGGPARIYRQLWNG
jgi:site-specific DNA-methyltransferase (adenine-specific)